MRLVATVALLACAAACQPPGGGPDDEAFLAPDEDGKADGAWAGPRLFAAYAARFEIRVRGVNKAKHPECANGPIGEDSACWKELGQGGVASNHGGIMSGLVTATQAGDSATLRFSLCDLRNTRYVNAKVLPATYDNVAKTSFRARMGGADPTDAQGAYSLRSDDGVFLYGVKANLLTNPAADPLPTDKKDPRVDDPDRDREPGLTFDDKIRVFIATRFVTPFEVASGDGGALQGTYRSANVKYDFIVYGDGIPFVDPAIGAANDARRDTRVIEQTTTTTLLPLRQPAPSCRDALSALPVLNLPLPIKE